MKRNLLAIAIPALLVAGAANAGEVVNSDGANIDLYGRVYASDYLKSKANTSSARIGLKAESKISDSVTGYGKFEWEAIGASFDGTTPTIDNRYAFAGLNFGNIGSLDYGKNDGVVYGVSSYTDVLPEFGGDASGYGILADRTANVLTYSNSDFFGVVSGLDFALQYADKASNKFSSGSETREAYGLNAQYAILDTGVKVGAAYSSTSTAGDSKATTSYVVGANYDANNVYLGAIYLGTDKLGGATDTSISGFEVVAKYGIDFEVGRLTPSLAYISHEKKVASTTSDLAKYIDLGVQYDFNQHVTALVDYKFNQIKDSKDQVALGLIYNF